MRSNFIGARESPHFWTYLVCLILLVVLYSIVDPYLLLDRLGLAMTTVLLIIYFWKDVRKLLKDKGS